MNWGGWREFWRMGGYGGYVWGAYGAVALAVLIESIGVRMRLARARRLARGRRASARGRG